jgi:adenylate cyclase
VLTLLAAGACVAAGAWAWRMRRRALVVERRLARATHDLEALEHAFTKFAPHEVVERIIADGVATTADTKEVTVLFADLQGFTALAETLEPAALVALLNEHFERMARAVAAHRGHLAKFIGDGLLALFGALEPNPWQTNDALHGALAMRAAMAAHNAELRARGQPALAMGIGVHRGPVVAGVIGSAELVEYAVIGSTVNLASRVEGTTKQFGIALALSQATYDALDFPSNYLLRDIDRVQVLGRSAPVTVYEVFEGDPPERASRKRESQAPLAAAIAAYRAQDIEACQAQLQLLQLMDPDDEVVRRYLARCAAHRERGVEAGTDMVEVLGEK